MLRNLLHLILIVNCSTQHLWAILSRYVLHDLQGVGDPSFVVEVDEVRQIRLFQLQGIFR